MASGIWPATVMRGAESPESPPVDDDETLVLRAKEDAAAFAPLYQRYVRPVYGYCFQRLGNRELAEDATSQVFVQAFAALPRYRAESFRGWIFTIAHNVVADVHRRHPTAPLDDARGITDRNQSPEDVAISVDAERSVRRLLALLNHDQREVIELRLAGLNGAEIAEVLGRRQGAIRATQFRAFQLLREFLAMEGDC